MTTTMTPSLPQQPQPQVLSPTSSSSPPPQSTMNGNHHHDETNDHPKRALTAGMEDYDETDINHLDADRVNSHRQQLQQHESIGSSDDDRESSSVRQGRPRGSESYTSLSGVSPPQPQEDPLAQPTASCVSAHSSSSTLLTTTAAVPPQQPLYYASSAGNSTVGTSTVGGGNIASSLLSHHSDDLTLLMSNMVLASAAAATAGAAETPNGHPEDPPLSLQPALSSPSPSSQQQQPVVKRRAIFGSSIQQKLLKDRAAAAHCWTPQPQQQHDVENGDFHYWNHPHPPPQQSQGGIIHSSSALYQIDTSQSTAQVPITPPGSPISTWQKQQELLLQKVTAAAATATAATETPSMQQSKSQKGRLLSSWKKQLNGSNSNGSFNSAQTTKRSNQNHHHRSKQPQTRSGGGGVLSRLALTKQQTPSPPAQPQPQQPTPKTKSDYGSIATPAKTAAVTETTTTTPSRYTVPIKDATPQKQQQPPPPRKSSSLLSAAAEDIEAAADAWPTTTPLSPLTPGSPTTGRSGRRIVQHQQQQRHGHHHHHHNKHNGHRHSRHGKQPHYSRPHETIHAQSLLLGLAFCAVWSPSNLMAPNLTDMASTFGMHTEQERDLYLGSYCALATGVLSFPIAATIGIWADLMPRKGLFVGTCLGGAAAALCTAYSQTYWQLLLARFFSGGCMSGSVPVAFSFLSDLFAAEERNAASSGLTAMMGLGIILGQVYAGMMPQPWPHAFCVSAAVTAVLAVLCAWLVQEPVRGGKEQVLQDMLRAGTSYNRKLTWSGFCHAMQHNESNGILLWQGFFSSLPWGIIFVFLNDYLSQERGFSVPDATYLVLLFGLGCAAGGVLGGYCGQVVQRWDRSYLPLFMSATTAAGILPFVALLNTHFVNAHGVAGIACAGLGGCIASLPAVNVRPCLINVNPPETRGASLTAANLLIQLGRGVGPSCVTLMGSLWGVDRQFAFNVTLIVFWLVSAFQLLLLARSLPRDQDAMETELALYAKTELAKRREMFMLASSANNSLAGDGGGAAGAAVAVVAATAADGGESVAGLESIVSIEERMTSFDGVAMRQSFLYVREGILELQQEAAVSCGNLNPFQHCDGGGMMSTSSSDEDLISGGSSSSSSRAGGRLTPLESTNLEQEQFGGALSSTTWGEQEQQEQPLVPDISSNSSTSANSNKSNNRMHYPRDKGSSISSGADHNAANDDDEKDEEPAAAAAVATETTPLIV